MSETEDRDSGAGASSEAQRSSALDDLRAQLERSGERLQRGRRLKLPAAVLPARSLGAMAIFIAVFVVVYLLTWAALGTIGVAVGFFAGAVVGALAVKLFADRAGAAEG